MAGIRKLSVLALAVTMAAVFAGVSSAVDHTVGDATGWNIPPSSPSTFYSEWASRQTFRVGDVLVFNFAGHTVAQVSQASYDACSSSNPLSSPITTSPARITLNTTGTHYFLCTIQGHCSLGQRLAVTVTGPLATGPSASSNPPPPAAGNSAAPTAAGVSLFSLVSVAAAAALSF